MIAVSCVPLDSVTVSAGLGYDRAESTVKITRIPSSAPCTFVYAVLMLFTNAISPAFLTLNLNQTLAPCLYSLARNEY